MCGRLCLVIKTVNDRGGTDKNALRGWGGVHLSLTRVVGHNSMCGDCVEGLASRPVDCCVGAAAFAFQAFPLLLAVPQMSLFSDPGLIRKEIRRMENMIVASVMCDLSHMPTPFHLFWFYVMLAALSVMRRFESPAMRRNLHPREF